MKYVLSLFGFSLSPVAVMGRKSAKAFSMFTKTLEKLNKLHERIEEHKAEHLKEIAEMQANHDALQAQQEKNTRLREKLADFVA